MATLHRFNGYRVFTWSNDHRPAHVDVEKAGKLAIFYLHCPEGPVSLRENHGFTTRELRTIATELNSMVLALCEGWEAVHGQS